jgi:hypothetical protein
VAVIVRRDGPHLVVDHAPEAVEATPQCLAELRTNPDITSTDGTITMGTAGYGVGVVTYQFDPAAYREAARIAAERNLPEGHIDVPLIQLTKIEREKP